MKNKTDFQIVLSFRTHRQIQQDFPVYTTENSPVPTKEIHENLAVVDFSDKTHDLDFTKAKGIGLFIPDDISYEEYLKIVEHAYTNPLSQKVFQKVRNDIIKEVENA